MVWNSSLYIGCGRVTCNGIHWLRRNPTALQTIPGRYTLLLCLYTPGGNLHGQKPYRTCQATDTDEDKKTPQHTTSTQPPPSPNVTMAMSTDRLSSTSKEKTRRQGRCSHPVKPARCKRNKAKACRREKACLEAGKIYHLPLPGGHFRTLLHPDQPRTLVCDSRGKKQYTRCQLNSAVCRGKVDHCVKRASDGCCDGVRTRTGFLPHQIARATEMWSGRTAAPSPSPCQGRNFNTAISCQELSLGDCGWKRLQCTKSGRSAVTANDSGPVCTSDGRRHKSKCSALRHICSRNNRCERIVPLQCCANTSIPP